jgi:hypothetical protein
MVSVTNPINGREGLNHYRSQIHTMYAKVRSIITAHSRPDLFDNAISSAICCQRSVLS